MQIQITCCLSCRFLFSGFNSIISWTFQDKLNFKKINIYCLSSDIYSLSQYKQMGFFYITFNITTQSICIAQSMVILSVFSMFFLNSLLLHIIVIIQVTQSDCSRLRARKIDARTKTIDIDFLEIKFDVSLLLPYLMYSIFRYQKQYVGLKDEMHKD